MFRNKLIALEHPTPESMDHTSQTQFASTVLWLEDQKIRHYKIEDREALRAFTEPNWEPAWQIAYKKYINDVGMPKLNNSTEELSWLLSYAVRLEYIDNVDTFKEFTAEKVLQMNKPINPKVSSTNPLDKMDMTSQEFQDGVKLLAKRLNIADHSNHTIVLEAAARIIHAKLRPEALKETIPTGQAFPIKDGDKCSFDDKDIDQAAKILRLLQIQSVRQLQTSINETIVAVQKLTADPRTDSKLGKVGY